jgi:hypothetical protein
MASQLISDSNLDLRLLPLEGAGADGNRGGRAFEDLPVIDLSSDEPLPEIPDGIGAIAAAAAPAAAVPQRRGSGSLWMEGDVLMCACPDCRAPMSVRLWLMIADCWKCGTSIELTEEQEREAKRLLRERAAAKRRSQPSIPPTRVEKPAGAPSSRPDRQPASTQPPPRPAPATPTGRRPEERRRVDQPTSEPAARRPGPSVPPASPRPPSDRRTPAHRRVVAAHTGVRRRLVRRRRPGAWLAGLLRNTPAWLVSLVFHLVLLTLLALFTFGPEDDDKYITLNAVVSKDLRRPGQEEIEHPADEVKFDLPIPEELDLQDRRTREAMVRADQDARELRLVDTADPQLPDLEAVKRRIGRPDGVSVALAARDPRVRVELLKQEGGTTLTEAAVARGLRWLSLEQQADGRWRLDGGTRSDSAATSLALLPFLGAGQTHLTGRYKDEVAKGLRWLVANQLEDGDLRAGSSGNTGMYAHGQGAIVLCEAFLMTGDEALREPAQKAIDFIVAAQYPDGGWRYQPNKEASGPQRRGDTSVVGWQLMALQSARAAKLHIPEETFELANHYLDSAQHQDGALYAYQPGNRPTHPMTAEALLCRIYLGWTKDMPALVEGVQYLADDHMPDANDPHMYYWYYATQTFHHVGGTLWERWNLKMRDVLVNTQEKEGRHAGSWAPRGGHASAGGRVYMTSLAVCTLEVYYRHLPIFRQIDVD